jgi:hypothetical protein
LSRINITNLPGVANLPIYPFKYSRSRHAISSVTWPSRSSESSPSVDFDAVLTFAASPFSTNPFQTVRAVFPHTA